MVVVVQVAGDEKQTVLEAFSTDGHGTDRIGHEPCELVLLAAGRAVFWRCEFVAPALDLEACFAEQLLD